MSDNNSNSSIRNGTPEGEPDEKRQSYLNSFNFVSSPTKTPSSSIRSFP